MTCAWCGRRNRADANFCDQCGRPLSVLEPVRKVVTVVFGDLTGSTALLERLDPELAATIMDRYYRAMRRVIDQHGGRLEKLIGDGVLAVFGAPTTREGDAVRAVRCAVAMRDEVTRISDGPDWPWGAALTMRAGAHTGEVVVTTGAELVGDTMNTAARLEQAAAPAEVLIGETIWQLVRHHVQVEPAHVPSLRGKVTPVRTWRVLSATPNETLERAAALQARLVGRAPERERLAAALGRVESERRSAIAVIIGAPGVGKTRLLREFETEVMDRAVVIRSRCESLQSGDRCLSSIEVPAEGRAVTQVTPVGRSGGDRPVVLVVDGLHEAPVSLLEKIGDRLSAQRVPPVLLVATARPRLRELHEPLTRRAGIVDEVVELPPLTAPDGQALLNELLGRHRLPNCLLERIVATSEGNPLFLIESVRMLIDDGYLVPDSGAWTCISGAELVPVAPSIHQLLNARLERLHPNERFVLERAAVIGHEFSREPLAALMDHRSTGDLDRRLHNLELREMIELIGRPAGGTYRFTAELIRDAAYNLLLLKTRADLHRRYATWLRTSTSGTQAVATSHQHRADGYRRLLGADRSDTRSSDSWR